MSEVGALSAAVKRTHPSVYAIPWYLVLGRTGSGKTSAVLRMMLDWSAAGTLPPVPGQTASYHLAAEAAFIEPGRAFTMPGAKMDPLEAFCRDVKAERPREPVDGILLVISAADIADLGDADLEKYALSIREQLVAAEAAFEAEVPTYVVLTRFDTLWGFGEAFQWDAERAREEGWGFVLPEQLGGADYRKRLQVQIDGLLARFESHCFARMSGDDHPEARTRTFQHLAEVRDLLGKLFTVMDKMATGSAFEKAPWIRALALGSGVPGVGDKLRARALRFTNMGLAPAVPAQIRPGGLPFHHYMKVIVLPERDLVPTRVRWRDDIPFVAGVGLAVIVMILAIVSAFVEVG